MKFLIVILAVQTILNLVTNSKEKNTIKVKRSDIKDPASF